MQPLADGTRGGQAPALRENRDQEVSPTGKLHRDQEVSPTGARLSYHRER